MTALPTTGDASNGGPRPPAAVVLTGGEGRRLGGVDKSALLLHDRTLLDHALRAVGGCRPLVVVGPRAPVGEGVTWAREDPPGSGPAAGLLAGLDALAASRPGIPAGSLVCVLAVDMPGVTGSSVRRLVDVLTANPGADGACLTDAAGRQQWLAGVYRYDALAAARPADRVDEPGLPVRRLLQGLTLLDVPAAPGEVDDVDTWDDWRRLGGTPTEPPGGGD